MLTARLQPNAYLLLLLGQRAGLKVAASATTLIAEPLFVSFLLKKSSRSCLIYCGVAREPEDKKLFLTTASFLCYKLQH